MPNQGKTLIMKFGGKAVSSPASFSSIAELILQRSAVYPRIAIVVSAMGDMTDQLIALAREVNPTPPRREYDMLVSAGERISISLLAMALDLKGKEAVSFTGSQSGILTTSEHSDAKIIDVKPDRLLKQLDLKKIVIVAGFQGMSREKEITTLGRGGSDTTAVALGIALGAEKVEFLKDVEGIYAEDPKKKKIGSFFCTLSYDEALQTILATGGKILNPRCVTLAKKNSLALHIRSFAKPEDSGTWIKTDHAPPKRAIYEE